VASAAVILGAAILGGPVSTTRVVGTALECVVALNRKWMYLAPASTGLGVFALLIGLPAPVGAPVWRELSGIQAHCAASDTTAAPTGTRRSRRIHVSPS